MLPGVINKMGFFFLSSPLLSCKLSDTVRFMLEGKCELQAKDKKVSFLNEAAILNLWFHFTKLTTFSVQVGTKATHAGLVNIQICIL